MYYTTGCCRYPPFYPWDAMMGTRGNSPHNRGFHIMPTIVSSLSWVDLLIIIVTFVLPLINGFLTKQTWAPLTKGISLAVLSAVFGFLNELLNASIAGAAFDIGQAALTWSAILVGSIASYFGILSRPITSAANGHSEKGTSVAQIVAARGVK